jgi:hypothetical protein
LKERKNPQSKLCTTVLRNCNASAVEAKKSKTLSSEKWQPLVSSSPTVAGRQAGRVMLQWTEYQPCYSWNSNENENLIQETNIINGSNGAKRK